MLGLRIFLNEWLEVERKGRERGREENEGGEIRDGRWRKGTGGNFGLFPVSPKLFIFFGGSFDKRLVRGDLICISIGRGVLIFLLRV